MVLMDQHTLPGSPATVFSLPLYVSKYHVRSDDMLPGGILCDIPLNFLIRMPNKLEIFLVLPIAWKIKTDAHIFGASLNNSSFDYALCCGIVSM